MKCKPCAIKDRNDKLARGPDHHWFDPNANRDRQAARWGQRDQNWAREVFSRFDGVCIVTGETANLAAHHLLSRAKFPDYRFDPLNGVALQRELHVEFHRVFGQVGFTPQDFSRFVQSKCGKTFQPAPHLMEALP
jgi:hypothetical protein